MPVRVCSDPRRHAQEILGHSSLEAVRMYVQPTSEDVQVRHRQYSPVDRIQALRGGSRAWRP
jgi:hypothetical protein